MRVETPRVKDTITSTAAARCPSRFRPAGERRLEARWPQPRVSLSNSQCLAASYTSSALTSASPAKSAIVRASRITRIGVAPVPQHRLGLSRLPALSARGRSRLQFSILEVGSAAALSPRHDPRSSFRTSPGGRPQNVTPPRNSTECGESRTRPRPTELPPRFSPAPHRRRLAALHPPPPPFRRPAKLKRLPSRSSPSAIPGHIPGRRIRAETRPAELADRWPSRGPEAVHKGARVIACLGAWHPPDRAPDHRYRAARRAGPDRHGYHPASGRLRPLDAGDSRRWTRDTSFAVNGVVPCSEEAACAKGTQNT